MTKEKLVFEIEDRGYTCKAYYLKDSGDALIEIFKDEKLLREFTFPAYKVYNISAHFNDIVDTEIWSKLSPMVRTPHYKNGYKMASWTGF